MLKRVALANEVQVNIEANHATLGGHTFEHITAMARGLGIFESIDANRGEHQNGLDIDPFPNSVEELTLAVLEIIRAGGFTTGGFNFDAKVRHQCIDAVELIHGHIGGITTIAKARLTAKATISDGKFDAFRKERYARWQCDLGSAIHAPEASLASIAELTISRNLQPQPKSGRQGWLENIINRFQNSPHCRHQSDNHSSANAIAVLH